LHQVGDLFELNVKLRCQKVKLKSYSTSDVTQHFLFAMISHLMLFGKNTLFTVRIKQNAK